MPTLSRTDGILTLHNRHKKRRRLLACGINNDLTDETEMVREMRHKANDELLLWIRERKYTKKQCADDNRPVTYYRTPYRLHDRLTQLDIDRLVWDFKAGTAKHTLAERYGINIKSVKKLLRERGVKRRSRWDRAA